MSERGTHTLANTPKSKKNVVSNNKPNLWDKYQQELFSGFDLKRLSYSLRRICISEYTTHC